jgi:uncharacterized protein (TIGR02678 family)
MSDQHIEIAGESNMSVIDIPEVMPEDLESSEAVIEEQAETRRSNVMTAARMRAYNTDLTKAHVALMEREVILPQKHLELYRLINRHYRELQNWHDQHTGWRIQRTTTVIRLIRRSSITTQGYLYERLKEPKDFACLTWILWFAENRQMTGRGNDQQFLLSQLAEQIQQQSAHTTDSEKEFDFRRQHDRYNIQRALALLEDLGGMQLVDGQTREWVEQTPDADVLYEFTDVIRSLVTAFNPEIVATASQGIQDLAARLQPSLLPAISEITPALVRAWRTLLLGPALFRFDDEAAFDALRHHTDAIANELLETFGWLLDIHRDYACIVRASGTTGGPVNSLNMIGANDQITMLLCSTLRKRVEAGSWVVPDQYGCLHVTTGDFEEIFYAVRERYGEHWGNEARGKSSNSLLNEVYKKMRQAGLLRGPDDRGNLLVLPTAARYVVRYDDDEEMQSGRKNTRRSTKAKDTAHSAMMW